MYQSVKQISDILSHPSAQSSHRVSGCLGRKRLVLGYVNLHYAVSTLTRLVGLQEAALWALETNGCQNYVGKYSKFTSD